MKKSDAKSRQSDGKSDEKGYKLDKGKDRFDLIPGYSLTMLAKVYTMGAEKYTDNNWRKGMRWGKVYAAVQRHLIAFWAGEDNDKESDLSHLAHATWGLFTLLEYTRTHKKFDDRAKTGNSK